MDSISAYVFREDFLIGFQERLGKLLQRVTAARLLDG
jgi:hypothetical protein